MPHEEDAKGAAAGVAYETASLPKGRQLSPPLSEALRRTAQRLAAEEVASVYRHDLTGKLGAARMLLYTLKRRAVGEGAPLAGDRRAAETLELLESSLRGALAMLERPLLVDAPDVHDPVDVAELLGDVFEDAIAHGRVRFDAPAPVWVDADGPDVAIALIALVENGLAVAAHVDLCCSEVGERARIEVSDDGPGLPEAADDATPFSTTAPGHLGIGLRVVRRVARRWGGQFEVRREGGRTVTCLWLPAISMSGGRASSDDAEEHG